MKFPTVIVLIVCLILAALLASGMRFANEDLFTALCAGRDALNGKLAQPDDWSFVTNGKVWVNQNWLSGVVYYISYLGLDEWGPFSIKIALLVSCLVILYFRCRRLGAGEITTLYAMILGVLSIAPFAGIRPENFGIFFCLLLTTFLTAPRSWGHWRWTGAVLTIWIWSNSHGSFALGLVYIVAKLVIEVGRSFKKSAAHTESPDVVHGAGSEVICWTSALILSLFLAAFANPFGPANLLMPFTQVGAEDWVRQNVDWQPLYRWDSLKPGLFAPTNTWPFLFVLVLMTTMALAVAFKRSKAEKPTPRVRGDVLTEVVIFVVAAVFSFRFKRFIPFAGMLAIPLLAYLIQSVVAAFATAPIAGEPGRRRRSPRSLHTAFCCVLLILLTWAFCAKTLLPQLPGNPMLPDMPLAAQHMKWNRVFESMVKFMKANQIPVRVLSSWPFSDFLIFHVPNIRVFVCGRAQTMYSNENLRHYLSIVRTDAADPDSAASTLGLLDKLGVELVVMPDTGNYSGLIDVLVKSRKWVGVYADGQAVILVKNEPRVTDRMGNGLGLQALHYPDHRTEVIGRTLMSFCTQRGLDPALMSELKDIAQDSPDSSIYWLIGNGKSDDHGRLDPDAREYLVSELKRLARTPFMSANGANSVLKSVVEIASILERDEKSRPPGTVLVNFGKIADQYMELFYKVHEEFLPH